MSETNGKAANAAMVLTHLGEHPGMVLTRREGPSPYEIPDDLMGFSVYVGAVVAATGVFEGEEVLRIAAPTWHDARRNVMALLVVGPDEVRLLPLAKGEEVDMMVRWTGSDTSRSGGRQEEIYR